MIKRSPDSGTPLSESEQRFALFAQVTQDALWEWDVVAGAMWCNDGFFDTFGYPSDTELTAPFWLDRVHPDDLRPALEYMQTALRERQPSLLVECRFKRGNGDYASIIARAAVLYDAAGNAARLVGGVVDVTAHKQALDALTKSEERYRSLVEQAADAIFVVDDSGNFVSANPATCHLLGYSAEETLTLNIHNVLLMWSGPVQLDLNSSLPLKIETRYRRADGTLLAVENTFNRIAPGLVEVIARDMTQRERFTEALLASEARYRVLVETASEGIWLLDLKYRTVFVNPALAAMLGYSADEMVGKPSVQFMHPGDLPMLMAQRRKREEGSFEAFDIRMVRKDGSVIWVLLSSRPSKDQHGRQEDFLVMVTDVTRRKQAEEQLRATAERLGSILRHAPLGIVLADRRNCLVETNQAFEKMLGYSAAELKGKSLYEITHPSDLAASAAMYEGLLRGEQREFEMEKRYIRKDGKAIWAVVFVALLQTDATDGLLSIGLVEDVTAKKAAQQELSRLAGIVETTSDAVVSVSLEGKITSWNKGAEHLYGYSAGEAIGQPQKILMPPGHEGDFEEILRTIVNTGRALERLETVRVVKSGELVPISVTISPLRDEDGRVVGVSGIAHDLSEAKKAQQMEEHLKRAQKLEALGQLAGGVAHDFNNVLMVISSYAEMMQEKLAAEDAMYGNTQQILKAVQRATTLTRQMLAFGRKQVLSAQTIDLNALIGETVKMVRRLIRESIELSFLPREQLWTVEADPDQVTQVLLNLCVNARDAMPSGGTLTISTDNVLMDGETAGHPTFLQGEYVMLSVTDTGTGMTKEVQERIFEPFFTTKGVGKGTGLGLATVYGIVKQTGGHIGVESEPDKGSCFMVYFPKAARQLAAKATTMAQSLALEGKGETVLVVEDEPALRESVTEYLKTHGYVVLEASCGPNALEVAEAYPGPIHLLLTDVVMPKMSGIQLDGLLHGSRPDMLTLLMSGYADEVIEHHGVPRVGTELISKPFSLVSLIKKMRTMLG